MSKWLYLDLIFTIITIGGFYLAYLYGRKTRKFRWSEYIAIIIWSLLFVMAYAYYINFKILFLFVASAIIGFTSENLLGLIYYKVLNKNF